MEIKTAIIEDAEAILALQRLAYQSEAANYDFTIRPLTETLEDIKDRFHDRRFLKAIEDGQIVGSVRAFQDDEACHVERLVVHPDYQRRGIGMALLKMSKLAFLPHAALNYLPGKRAKATSGYTSGQAIGPFARSGSTRRSVSSSWKRRLATPRKQIVQHVRYAGGNCKTSAESSAAFSATVSLRRAAIELP